MRLQLRLIAILFPILLGSFVTIPATAQVVTGTPQFGSFSGGPDVVNNANLNVHLAVPLIHKLGRGTNFDYDIIYDSSVWNQGGSGSSRFWLPVANWGWGSNSTFGTGLTGYINFSSSTTYCYDGMGHINGSDVWVGNSYYVDPWGSGHYFSGYQETKSGGCGSSTVNTFPSLAKDGSGFTNNGVGGPIVTKDGKTISPPVNPTGGAYSSTVTDRNGNQVNADGSGNFFDTLSTTAKVLTVSGVAPSPISFKYTSPLPALVQYTMNFTNYTVATNFAVSGISEYRSTAAVPLVTSIMLPDSSQYTFSYEPTPSLPTSGACTPYAGTSCVTARIAKITLPTGASITYRYSGGAGTNGSGIFADGSAATLTRATLDGNWTYAQTKGTGAASTTVVTDPQSNSTTMSFQGIYQTQSQTPTILTTNTCYNGAASPCIGTAVSIPITQRTTISTLLPGNQQSEHVEFYSPYGMPSETDDYDYGSGAPGPLLKKTVISYASLGNINAAQQTVTVCNGLGASTACNGSGTVVSQTTYNYDETTLAPTSGTPQQVAVSGRRGNLTTVTYPAGTSSPSHITYFDTGMAQTTTASNGALTTYGVSSCGNAFPTSITEPLSMSRAFVWDCTGAVITKVTDENNQSITTTYSDQYFWRPSQRTYPDGGQLNWVYNSNISTKITQKMNSSQNKISTILLDGLGRTKQQQLTSDPQGTVYVDTTYDSLGRLYSTTNPYRSTSDSTYGLTKAQYDALGRPSLIIPPDGTSSTNNVAISYTNNCATTKDQAGKSTESCFDGLGRATQVFEDPANIKYESDYTYDPLGNLLTANQIGGDPTHSGNWRTRTYTYDGLSRLTSEKNPESGSVSYTYNLNGDLATKIAPAPNQTGSSTVTTTYTSDLLHRLTKKSYSDGTPTANFYFDSAPSYWAAGELNTVGRLVEATTSNSATEFSYDPMGRISQRVVCTPINCTVGPNGQTGQGWAYYYTYNLAGGVTQFNDGIYTWPQYFNQTYDGAGRVTLVTSTVSDAQHPATFFTSDATNAYYPNGALQKAMLGNGLTLSNVYDNRLNPCLIDVNNNGTLLKACTDGTPPGNVLDFWIGYNNGTSDNGDVTNWNATGAQSFVRSYGYDTLNRVSTMGDTVAAQPCKGLSWTYDPWGNRTAQTMTSGTCGQFSATVNAQNQLIDTINNLYKYDAAGNMTHDASHSYTYDAENRLTSVDGGATASYIYDALGRRVKRTIGSASYEYIYDKDGHIAWELLNGSINRTYIRSNGFLLAEYSQGTTYFIHRDHLGSTRLLTGYPTPTTVECDDYYPFGEANSCGANTATTLKFTGHERDTETNLDHTLFRQNSSTLGRWMTPDPGGLAVADPGNPQTLNRYPYVADEPTNGFDPDGLRCTIYVFGVKDNSGAFDYLGIPSEASAYPYSDMGLVQAVASAGFGAGGDSQSLTDLLAKYSTEAGGVDLVSWSGGAQTISTVNQNDSSLLSNVASTTYLSPGINVLGGDLYQVPGSVSFKGSGIADFGTTLGARLSGVHLTPSQAKGHGFANEFKQSIVQDRVTTFPDSRGPCTGGANGAGGDSGDYYTYWEFTGGEPTAEGGWSAGGWVQMTIWRGPIFHVR
jgi:RHS repeat-associated protein